MLGKLLKIEFRSTSRILLILYAAVLACGAILGFALGGTSGWQYEMLGSTVASSAATTSRAVEILSLFLTCAYALLIIMMMVLTVIMIVLRFYKNMLGGEGYLMHTLPVPTWMHVASKLIVSFVWILIATLVAFLSVGLLLLTSGLLPAIFKNPEIWSSLQQHIKLIWTEMPLGKRLFLASTIISTIASVLELYFAMAIGNLANEHKVLFSVLAYIGISFATSMIGSILMIPVLGNLGIESMMNRTLLRATICNAVLAVVFFAGTTRILRKHLNLA